MTYAKNAPGHHPRAKSCIINGLVARGLANGNILLFCSQPGLLFFIRDYERNYSFCPHT